MRVLHVQETLAPSFGGPAKVLPELARAQAQSGMDVEILTTNVDSPRGTYIAAGGRDLPATAIPVTYCSVAPRLMRISVPLARYLRDNIRRFDLVHVHGLYRFPQSYAARYARKAGLPYVIRPYGSLDPYLFARSSRSVRLKRLYEYLIDAPNLNGASAIHYTAQEERDRAAFLKLRAPSFIVPNGVPWADYERLPERGAIRARFALGERPLVLFLGRLHRKKGLDILIEAFATVLRDVPEAQLLVVGPDSGDVGDELQRWASGQGIRDSVRIAGPLYGPDVLKAYVDADVFALPSYTENFGMSVVEAMACGAPVVVSDQVNIHAEVSAAGAGLVTRCDRGEVARAITALLRDEGRRHSCADAGRRLVKSRFTWPSIVQTLKKEYETILERHRSGQ